MSDDNYITTISGLFGGDRLVDYALILTILYVGAFLLCYFAEFSRNFQELRNFNSLINKSNDSDCYDNLRKMARLNRSQQNGSAGDGSADATDVALRISRNLRAFFFPHRVSTRLSRAKGSVSCLFDAFEDVDSDRHRLEQIRPAAIFLVNNCLPSRVPIERAFTVLTQISLAITFAGLAAVLVIAGNNISNLANPEADANQIVSEETSPSLENISDDQEIQAPSENVSENEAEPSSPEDISGSVIQILSTAGSKFWITAFAYSFGLGMLLIYYGAEKIWRNHLRALGYAIESILNTDCALRHARKGDDNLSAQEKVSFQKILSENAENIANVGKEVNDKLIEKLARIATDNKAITDSILININSSFEDLAGKGLRIHVQDSFSGAMDNAIKQIADDASFSSQQIGELNTNIKELIVQLGSEVDEKPSPKKRAPSRRRSSTTRQRSKKAEPTTSDEPDTGETELG